MAQKYYEAWKKSVAAKKAMKKWISDPEELLSSNNSHCEGIYELRYVNENMRLNFSAYIGQAGHDQTAPRYVAQDVYERLLQHLKRMLGGDYLTYWTGLSEKDTDWKIELHLLEEESDHSLRLQKEEEYIRQRRPFLQDTANGKYELYPSKYGYKRNDLCIHPWKQQGEAEGQRRIAFLDRVSEELRKSKIVFAGCL